MLGAEEEEASGAGGKIATSEVTKLYSATLLFLSLSLFYFSILFFLLVRSLNSSLLLCYFSNVSLSLF